MALGITSARCTCEFDASNRCICTVDGRATVDSVGDYVIMRNWRVGSSLYGEVLDTKTVRAGDPTTFNYSGSFDNTNPDATEYDIQLNKSGVGPVGTEKVIYPDACEVPCPDPTVSITDVSNRNPESGEVVNFTGYASGGTGHSIVSRKWDFGDGTSSTLSNPSKSWKNTTGSPKSYTVRFTATNDCGKSRSTSTTITVASEVVKTGIEIQFPASLNGKQLIAHGAVSTVLDLWWTGPAVHGGLWTKGRATWDNIDSSKKYVIQTGDACETSLPRETPSVCAGTFANGDDVVILVRNPGFDFRVYGSGNVHKLSGTSFSVLYLDETSGDIITTAFTGRICALAEIPSGAECDAFWAEFYDPIFVANYMEIQATGKDMFGNERDLGWLDHVAFVASLVGSLPAFNLFPFAGITKQLGKGIMVLSRKAMDLAGDELSQAGGAIVDILADAPHVLKNRVQSEIDEIRAALVKVYGDIQGNKYVDDALAAIRSLVDEAHELLKNADTVPANADAVSKMLKDDPSLGGELVYKHIKLIMDGTPELDAVYNHAKIVQQDIIDMYHGGTFGEKEEMLEVSKFFTLLADDYYPIVDAMGYPKAKLWVKNRADISLKALRSPEPAVMDDIIESTEEYTHKAHTIAGDIEVDEDLVFNRRTLADDVVETTDNFVGKTTDTWNILSRTYVGGKFSNLATAIKTMSRREKFMSAWFFWELMSFVVGFMVLKAFGIFPGDRSFRAFQRCEAMSTAFFTCKSTCENALWDGLEDAITEYENAIKISEEYLIDNEAALKREHSYETLESGISTANISIELWRSCLANHGLHLDAPHAEVVFTSNVVCMAYVDDQAIGTVFAGGLLTYIRVGEQTLAMKAEGYTGCVETITLVEGVQHTFHCDLQLPTCVLPVPKITAPITAKAKESIQFTGSATTESTITRWYWDFGNDEESYIPNPSCIYWDPGTYLVQLFVTDDCGTATTTHTIVIEEEAPPPEEESGNLLINKPINKVTRVECTRAYNAEIFVDNVKVSSKAPFTIAFGTDEYVSGYGGQCGTHTIKVRLDGYQDVEQSWTINNGDDKSWTPEMYMVGYVPPVDKFPINFYIPEGAVLGEPVKVTTVSRIVAGMKRIGGQ